MTYSIATQCGWRGPHVKAGRGTLVSGRRFVTCVAVLAIACLLAAGCVGSPDRRAERLSSSRAERSEHPGSSPSPTPHAASGSDCRVSDILVPSCGAWWGISPGDDALADLESRVGRTFDLVQHWHGVDQTGIPTKAEKKEAKGGRLLHLNLASRHFSEQGEGAGTISYAAVASGTYDDALSAQARGLAAFGEPVFITFDHEPDADGKVGQRGSAREYVNAWRHVHDVYSDHGAANVIWVWVVTGYAGNFSRIPKVYPGNKYVDWISWEAYNFSSCRQGTPSPDSYRGFEAALQPFYNWLQSEGASHGIDAGKPYMITGMGSVYYADSPETTADWYRAIPDTLRDYPQIRAVQQWNDTGPESTCVFNVTADSIIMQGFTEAGKDPYVNPPYDP